MELSESTLLTILAAVLIADVVVVVLALIWTRIQKRRHRDEENPVAMPLPRSTASLPNDGRPYAAATTFADPSTDTLTGLLLAATWARIIGDEEARVRRYHRSATVVIIEIEGLDRLVARLGPGSVERIVPAVADTLRRGARDADHVARLAAGRFRGADARDRRDPRDQLRRARAQGVRPVARVGRRLAPPGHRLGELERRRFARGRRGARHRPDVHRASPRRAGQPAERPDAEQRWHGARLRELAAQERAALELAAQARCAGLQRGRTRSRT